MSLVKVSHKQERGYVSYGKSTKGKLLQAAFPVHQLHEKNHHIGYRSVQLDNVTSTAFTTASNVLKLKIDPQNVKHVKNVSLEVKVTESGGSNAMTLAPVPFWFDKIEIKAHAGNVDIRRSYPENQLFELALLQDEKLKTVKNLSNFSQKWFSANDSIAASGSRTYHMPLVGDWFSTAEPDLAAVKDDIYVEFHCRNGIVSSGSGVPQLDSLKLIFEVHEPNSDAKMGIHDVFAERKLLRDMVADRYLSVERIQETTTFTASTEKLINLENFHGKFAFLLVAIRANATSNTANANLKFLDLGEDATIDIKDQSQKSILGMGTAVNADLLQNIAQLKHGANSLRDYQNMYIIPFCDNIQAAIQGVLNGYMEFDGSTEYLAITPGAAGVSQIDAITCVNTVNDGGYYQLSHGGNLTNELKFEATPAVMKSAIEALPHLQDESGMTVTVNTALTASSTITWDVSANKTIGTPAQRYGPVKAVVKDLNDGGVVDITSSSTSTTGSRGWATGSYTISVYGYKYQESLLSNGRYQVIRHIR